MFKAYKLDIYTKNKMEWKFDSLQKKNTTLFARLPLKDTVKGINRSYCDSCGSPATSDSRSLNCIASLSGMSFWYM